MSEDKVREVSYNKTNVEEALERQIVRNSEILQKHRQMIEKLKSRMKRESHLRLAQVEKTTPKAEKFDRLKELFEKIINIIDQEYATGRVGRIPHDRVCDVREKHEELMRIER